MNISDQSNAPKHSGGLPPSALVARTFRKLDIALRARLLGRLLASVGPLALKVVGGGVFAKYVRHARSPEIPISFDDAAQATSSEVRDLVHYVEQSDPNLVKRLLAALSRNGVMATIAKRNHSKRRGPADVSPRSGA
jgi:hypothetical protein